MANKVKFYHVSKNSTTVTNTTTWSRNDGSNGIVFSEKDLHNPIFVNGVKYSDYDASIESINSDIKTLNTADVSLYLSGQKLTVKVGNKTSSMDAGDFIKDGMLTDASYDSSSHKLKLTWNTDNDNKQVDVDLSKLVDTVSIESDPSKGTKVYGITTVRNNNNTILVEMLDASCILFNDSSTIKEKVDDVSNAVDSVNTRIDNLDVTNTVTAGKYISSLTQNDGKISYSTSNLPSLTHTGSGIAFDSVSGHAIKTRNASTDDIFSEVGYDFGYPTATPTHSTITTLFSTIANEIKSTKSSIPSFSSLNGSATADSGYALSGVTQTNGKISRGSQVILPKSFDSPTANGNATAFIDSISYNANNGSFTVTKKNVTHPLLDINRITNPTYATNPFTGELNDDGKTLKLIYDVNNHTISTVDVSASIIPVVATTVNGKTVYNVSTYLDELKKKVDNTVAGVSKVTGGSNTSSSILTYVNKTTVDVSISSANIGTRTLTGYTVPSGGIITASDTINQAFAKLDGSTAALYLDSSVIVASGNALRGLSLSKGGLINPVSVPLAKSFTPTNQPNDVTNTTNYISYISYDASSGTFTASSRKLPTLSQSGQTTDNSTMLVGYGTASGMTVNFHGVSISSRTLSNYTTPTHGTIKTGDTINQAFAKLDTSVAELNDLAYWYEV